MLLPSKLVSLALIILLLPCSIFAQQSERKFHEAKRHLERAKKFELLNDPGAETEYNLAVETCEACVLEGWLDLSLYLASHLRFSEAATALGQYIKRATEEDQNDSRQTLIELRRASSLQVSISRAVKPEISELLEFTSLVSRYGRNKLRDALPYAEKAVTLYPTSSDAHVILARMLIGSRQQTRRLELLEKAIELDPDNPSAHHQLGWYYIESFHGQDAAGEFRKALDTSQGKLTEAWQGLGWALSNLGQNKEALAAFRNYLQSGEISQQYKNTIEQQIKKLEKNSQN